MNNVHIINIHIILHFWVKKKKKEKKKRESEKQNKKMNH